MPKFEYSYVSIEQRILKSDFHRIAYSFYVLGVDGEHLNSQEPGLSYLAKMGADGWDIASQSDMFIIFKRQIED